MDSGSPKLDHSSGRRWSAWATPVVAPILADRKLAISLGGLGVVQIALGLGRVRGVPCPVLGALGIPCPGCGASRACAALVSGDWAGWVRYHALAPAFVAGVVLLLAAGLLPDRRRLALAAVVDRVERRTSICKLFVILILVYWLTRLVYAPAGFAELMRS